MSRVTIVLKTNEGGMWVLPQIAELRRRGHQVTTILPRGTGRLRRALDEAGHVVVETPFDFSFRPGLALVGGLTRLRRAIRESAPDVVFYHLYASALAARLASIGLGVPRVHMVAGPLYLESPVIRGIERFLHKSDSHIIAGSLYTFRRYRALGRTPGSMSAIPYGVDTTRFAPIHGDREALFGVHPSTFVAIMVAYVYAPKSAVFPGVGIKGHDVLLAAWSEFSARHPESLLVIVGGGFDEAGEAHRKHLLGTYAAGPATRTRWFDSVDDVRRYYACADISVSPSLSENHGAALEASSMGLPSIVSSAGGLPETVSASSGWVVPPGDVGALLAALEGAHAAFEAGSLAPMGQAARRLMESKFEVTDAAARVADVLESAVERTPRALVVTEQRGWIDASGHIVGQKRLQAATALPGYFQCTVAARKAAASHEGNRLLPGSRHSLLLPWPDSFGDAAAGIRGLRELWRATGINDAVLVYSPGILGTVAGAMALARRKALIVAVVGDPAASLAPDVVGSLGAVVVRPVVRAAMRWFCRRASLARYVTSSTLQKAYPPGKHTVALGGTDVGHVPLGGPRERRQGTVRLLTVASLDRPYKGVRELILAVEAIVAKGHEIELVVAGDGRLRAELVALASKHLPGRAVFTGHIRGAALDGLYDQADVFILPSWAEGLPRALVEAMAAGLPCIASNIGGVPELLEHHRLAEPRNIASLAAAIESLLADPVGWRRSSERNVAVAKSVLAHAAAAESDFDQAVADLARRFR